MIKDYNEIIDMYYPVGSLRRDIYLRHCRSVADLSVEILNRKKLDLDPKAVEAAAMLHDIGIVMTSAPSIGCEGSEPYIAHGVLGADMLRRNGYDEFLARVAERHTGAGITAEEVVSQGLPIPVKDYMPQSELERLICYADKFYSKSGSMEIKPLDKVRRSMSRISTDTLRRFEHLHEEFKIPLTSDL